MTKVTKKPLAAAAGSAKATRAKATKAKARTAKASSTPTSGGLFATPTADRFWWVSTRPIAAFDGLGTPALRKAAGGGPKRPPKHFAVVVNSDAKKPMTDSCMRSMRDFDANEAAICKAVLAAIHKHYTMVRRTLAGLVGKEELAAIAPAVRSVSDMSPLIAFSTLHVHAADAAGSDLGFHFECAWEEEHGLGVRVRDGRVVMVASEEDAAGEWTRVQDSIKEMGDGMGV